MNEVIRQRNNLSKKIQKDINNIYDTLKRIDLEKFNKYSRFKWKCMSNSCGAIVRIFDSSAKWWERKHYIFIDDIEQTDCFIKIINNKDERLELVIQEAIGWIEGECEIIQNKIYDFEKMYIDTNQIIQDTIQTYKSLGV